MTWRATALRTGAIALAVGAGVGLYRRRLDALIPAALLALWFALGGHFVEVLFRNQLRHRLGGQPVRIVARLAYWFAGGTVLYAGARATRAILTGQHAGPWPWWIAGVGFVVLELLIHWLLHLRGNPNLYDGRG
ncbi:MAG: hypothetical protein ACRERC_09215 [Candidatus Binatia bacterium]